MTIKPVMEPVEGERWMTDEKLKQLADWYADPVRKLPRKVVSDVLALIGALRALLP